VNFHVFSVSGDFFWKDGEYFARKVSYNSISISL
jgi:predicted heme/steroid binding protein